jgi:spermidine synthase
LRRSLEALGLHDFFAVFGGYLADGRALAAYAGEGPINTDDRPTVLFSAPSVVYGPEASPHHLLLDLLRNLQPRTDALINPADNPHAEEALRRLSAYWTARNRFIEAGVAVRRTADARELLVQVREPLLRVVRLSPDFDPAYRPLLAMAAALHPKRPQDARQLLRELAEASPHRPEALRLLERFAASQAGDGSIRTRCAPGASSAPGTGKPAGPSPAPETASNRSIETMPGFPRGEARGCAPGSRSGEGG